MPASESDYRNTAGCRNPVAGKSPPAGIRRHPATAPNAGGIWPESGYGQKPAGIRPDLTGFGQNGRDPAGSDPIRRCPAGIRQFWPDLATATGRRRIPATFVFSLFVIFSCEPNAEKYFRKNNFF
jgi:hypothetical protein